MSIIFDKIKHLFYTSPHDACGRKHHAVRETYCYCFEMCLSGGENTDTSFEACTNYAKNRK